MSTISRFFTLTAWTITAAFILSIRLSQPQAASAEYIIDSDHFSIGFLVEHIGYAKILGMFRKAEGQFIFDEDSLLLSELNVLIHTESVFTNHKKRDDHLRSVDFLNVREFPEMTFSSTSSKRTGERTGKVNGLLTLTGKTLPMNLDVTWNKSGIYPFGHKKYTIGVSARGSFRRSSYDMNYAAANGWVGDEIQLIIELEAVQQ